MAKIRWIFLGRWAVVTAPVVCALPVFLVTLLTEYISIAPWGSELRFALMMFVVAGMVMVILGAGLVAAIGVFSPDMRLHATTLLFCAVACFAAIKGGVLIGEHLRWRKCVQLAEIGRPLIAAIDAYERKYDRCPASLQALVPEFLP